MEMTLRTSETDVPPIGVGLIGLGLMGSAFADRLSARGFRVVGYDCDPARCRTLEARGGYVASDAASVLRDCDRVLLSLPDSRVVQSVLAEADRHLRPGQLMIDTTTGSPPDAAALGHRLCDRGVSYLDATFSGSSAQVRAADAIILAGGERAAFARCEDLFRLFARRAFHVGPWGSGATMKLVTNLVLGLNRAALAEGLALAKAIGVDGAQALAMLKESAAYSRVMDTKGGRMVEGDFAPDARLSQHLKDVRLILATGDNAGIHLPLSETHRLLLEAAERAGLGELDNSSIVRILERGSTASPEEFA
jgi:3-hydroxyisobutyrate dehydrogenase-like beta-hydroxyacid dehydrogenase